jgi:hypothetical protein
MYEQKTLTLKGLPTTVPKEELLSLFFLETRKPGTEHDKEDMHTVASSPYGRPLDMEHTPVPGEYSLRTLLGLWACHWWLLPTAT